MPYPDWSTYPVPDTVTFFDNQYPNGYTYHLFYTNPPANTDYRTDAKYSGTVAWYINRYIQQTADQQSVYFNGLKNGQKYIDAMLQTSHANESAIKLDTQQIITLLGGQSQFPVFNNYSAKLQSIQSDVSSIRGDLEPVFLSQSFSFICGCLAAIAFVLAVKTFSR